MLILLSSVLHASVSGFSIRSFADRSDVYIHAQLIFTIEIKSQLHLQNGSLAKPEIPDALIENLIEDEQKEVIENGQRTLVFTRSYAIFPSKAGALTIPSVIFEGSVVDPSGGGFGGFFGRGRRIRAATDAIAIEVKPIPSSFPKNQPFLPAKSLTVVESFDDEKHELNVNKALTRRFEIKALGSLSAFLPIMKTPNLKGCEVYSEAGVKNQEKGPEGILASVNFSQVYLPLEPGVVSIPEQTIYWWDTELDQLKTTPIRSFEFQVLPDANKPAASTTPDEQAGSNASANSPMSAPASTEPNITESVPSKKQSNWFDLWLWPSLAILFLLLWIATLCLMFLKKKPQKVLIVSQAQEKLAAHIARVQKACDEGALPQVLVSLRELLKWSLRHEEGKNIVTKLGVIIHELEGSLYGQKNINPTDVLSEVKNFMNEIKNLAVKKESLKTLYPF
jgi:hypothetical protein